MEELFRSARLGGGLEGGDMPLAAAEVRRRGDRIRRRRNALVAGGAALAVGAVATPIFALGASDPEVDRDRIAPQPTQVVEVSEADLMTDDDTEYMLGATDWFATDTVEGDGQAAFHPCAQAGLEDLGAESVLQRNFELRNLEPGAPQPKGSHLNESIAQFGSAEEARAAYDEVAQWVVDCEGRMAGATEYKITDKARTVEVPGADAVVYDMQWGPVPPELEDPYAEMGFFSETGIVVAGDRIAVLTLVTTGQDYNFSEGTPVERMLPRAAERLAPGD
jgi:hypothetical protein